MFSVGFLKGTKHLRVALLCWVVGGKNLTVTTASSVASDIQMQFVPWQNVADWHCKACGYCCKLYSVVLAFPEWLRLTKTFGSETTVAGLDRFYIKRTSDGSCAFLCSRSRNYFCGLQSMKPDACKIWPFKVLSEPKYGEANQAAFDYMGHRLYVYADAICCGLRFGVPTWEFRCTTVREFAELALGLRQVQSNTTGNVWGKF